MALSNDILSQFAKITDDSKHTAKETTAYGTIVETNGVLYVRLDGSNLDTPISTTTSAKNGDRVMVTIKNHTAIVTGNLTSPSASGDDVSKLEESINTKISEFDIILADKVDTEVLNAESARIDTLITENTAIRGRLEATEASIDTLEADNLTVNETLTAHKAVIDNLDATYAKIDTVDATYAKISDLEATNAEIYDLKTTYFSSIEADIETLKADKLDAEDADLKYATIAELDVERGYIEDLKSDVADIDNLIFGSATGDTIHVDFANAVIAQVGDAQIKSAMIENITASQIVGGSIITNNINVQSEDGRLLIADETISISDGTNVRVQIGKDASGDYSINIWDADGNLMFSEGGVTENAIKNAIIRDDMVGETANISASKLNIQSLFEEINGSSHTIKGSRIYLDDKAQTLDVAFTNLTTDVNGVTEQVSSQGTQISVLEGQIDSKIWQQDITTAIDDIEIGGRNLITDSAGEFGDDYEFLSPGIDLYPIFEEHGLTEYTLSMDMKSSDTTNNNTIHVYCQNGSGSYHNMGHTFTVTTEWQRYSFTFTPSVNVGYDRKESSLAFYGIYETGNYPRVKNIKLEKGNVATDWTPAPEDFNTEMSTRYSELTQTIDGFKATVSETYSTIDDTNQRLEETADRIATAESLIEQVANQISTLIVGSDGKSLMTQTESGWTFSIGAITDTLNHAIENIGTLEGDVNGLDGTVTTLQTIVNDLENLGSYVKIITDEDEPCIELGAVDSQFKVLITNTAIRFMEGASIPAYINNQALTIEKAIIKNELHIGGFVWKRRASGNVGLVWKGVEE